MTLQDVRVGDVFLWNQFGEWIVIDIIGMEHLSLLVKLQNTRTGEIDDKYRFNEHLVNLRFSYSLADSDLFNLVKSHFGPSLE